MPQGDQIRESAAIRLSRSQRDPILVDAALALRRNDLPSAERLLKARLRADDKNIAALRMLAELASRLGRSRDARDLLKRTLEIAPDFTMARANYATVLHRQNQLAEALAQVDILLAETPGDPGAQALKAAVLARTGDYAGAIALYEDVLGRFPAQARLWMSLGHALKTVGRTGNSIAAYRRAIDLMPMLGEAWWSLANLKTARFSADDRRAMDLALKGAVSASDRYHLNYALGKALEDDGDYEASFRAYAEGARLRRMELPYDAAETTRHAARTRRLMTPDVFAAREGQGCDDPSPIFIVGLPRSGSTLIEQILASHSLIEGTAELPELGALAGDLASLDGARGGEEERGYLDELLRLDGDSLRDLGQRYIECTRIHRKTEKPFFIDKMPNNFAHVGLIHLILPRAVIIDARRHPMASCFSAFKQHFSRGQGFSYDIEELGAYYRDYVGLMSHYDDVLTNRVYRVFYEAMVDDPETQIRQVLTHCRVAFEPRCLEFYSNDRPVRTASSEQVRRPINREGIDHWKHYEPWLGGLEAALGPTIPQYMEMSNCGSSIA